MNRSNDRWTKEKRQLDLAKCLVQHEVRTQVIVDWTGLSIYTIQNIYREYSDSSIARHRGLSPFQTSIFSRSRKSLCEGAALASIALDLQVIVGSGEEAAKKLPSLERGERLLTAFELFCQLVPDTRLRFEHAILLVTELTRGSVLALDRCTGCNGLKIVDRLGHPRNDCGFCRTRKRRSPNLNRAA